MYIYLFIFNTIPRANWSKTFKFMLTQHKYFIYTIDVVYGYKHKSWNFMNSNCCLQKYWGKKPWKFIVVPQHQNFSFFPFIFLFFIFSKKLLTSASFLFQINLSIFPFSIILAFSEIYSYIRFLEQYKEFQSILYCHI